MNENTWLELALRAVVALERHVEAYLRDVAMAERQEARLVEDLAERKAENTDEEGLN
jgi:hypothetical protein